LEYLNLDLVLSLEATGLGSIGVHVAFLRKTVRPGSSCSILSTKNGAAVQDVKAASVTVQLCVTASPGQAACKPSTLEVSVRGAAGEGQHNLEMQV